MFFFGFWVFVALVSFWLRNEKPKKTLSFFCFSHFFNHHFIQKNKKTLSFFSFFKVKTKKKQKNLGKTKKKNKHEPQTKHSLKSFVFLFFWFSRGFGYSVFPKIQPKSRKL